MDILSYPFFQHALVGSLLASIVCAFIGTYIVTRRLVFIGGGLTHASFGGVGIGLYTGIPPLLGAAVFAVLSAFGVQWMSRSHDIREDSAIAVCWALGMSTGIVFTYLTPSYAYDLSAYLFGNILTITWGDILLLASVTLAVLTLFLSQYHTIVATAFDRQFALSRHLPVRRLEYTLMALTALTIVACLRIAGIVLVISLLTIPQTTANLLTHRYHGIILLSMLLSLLSCVGGLFLAYLLNVPSGACIIFTNVLLYSLAKTYKTYKTHKTISIPHTL